MKRKIVLLLISILLLGGVNVFASTNTYNREELENYGVNKHFKITDKNKSNILNTRAVDASEKIYDYAEILTEEEEKILKEKIDNFIENNKIDLIIVTDAFVYANDKENEDYAADFYDYNDFGMEFKNNSGILFFRNANSEDPYFDMYTFGNAQLYFDRFRYDAVLDGIFPAIKEQRYLEGMSDFINRTTVFIERGIPNDLKNYYVNKDGYLTKKKAKYKIPWVFVIISSIITTLIIMGILISKNKMVRKAHAAEEYLNKESVNITNRKDVFINTHTSSYTSSSSSSGGGYSSSSGSSGGGHSSGGGRHG